MKRFVIVEEESNALSVVNRLWLIDNNTLFRYPSTYSLKKIEQYLQNDTIPTSSWKYCKIVNIIGHSDELDRAYECVCLAEEQSDVGDFKVQKMPKKTKKTKSAIKIRNPNKPVGNVNQTKNLEICNPSSSSSTAIIIDGGNDDDINDKEDLDTEKTDNNFLRDLIADVNNEEAAELINEVNEIQISNKSNDSTDTGIADGETANRADGETANRADGETTNGEDHHVNDVTISFEQGLNAVTNPVIVPGVGEGIEYGYCLNKNAACPCASNMKVLFDFVAKRFNDLEDLIFNPNRIDPAAKKYISHWNKLGLPLENPSQINETNNRLAQDVEYRDEMIAYLLSLTRKNQNVIAYMKVIMLAVMTKQLASLYNYEGQKGKRSFRADFGNGINILFDSIISSGMKYSRDELKHGITKFFTNTGLSESRRLDKEMNTPQIEANNN